MNILIITGIVLGGGTIITDRYVTFLPNWLSVVLYGIAVILILAGMIVSKHKSNGTTKSDFIGIK